MWNVLKPFAKIVLTPFWLRAAAPATDAAIQNKNKKNKKKKKKKKKKGKSKKKRRNKEKLDKVWQH